MNRLPSSNSGNLSVYIKMDVCVITGYNIFPNATLSEFFFIEIIRIPLCSLVPAGNTGFVQYFNIFTIREECKHVCQLYG
jgi:hypothetical protein